MQKVFRINLDISKKIITPTFEVNTNDLNSIKLLIRITDELKPLDLTGITPRLPVRKPDNKVVFQDCEVVDAKNGQIEAILENQAYIVAGTHTAEIMCYKENDLVAVTGTFSYKAKQGIMNDVALESKNEFTSITNMLKDVQDTIDDIRENGTGVDAKARQDIQSVTTQLADTVRKNEVQSLVVNKAEKTYVDQQVSSLGQLKLEGSYDTLALLKTAKPTGATGLYLVTADGFTYRWNGSDWVKAAQFQSTGIGDKSVTSTKVADNLKQGRLFSTTYSQVKLDTIAKTIYIPSGYYLAYTGSNPISIPEQTIDFSQEQNFNFRLVYDLSLNSLLIKVESIYHQSNNYIELGSFRATGSAADKAFLYIDNYTVNGKPNVPDGSVAESQLKNLLNYQIVIGGGAYPTFEKAGHTVKVHFPKNILYLFDSEGKSAKQINTTDLPPVTVNFNQMLVWNVNDNQIVVIGNNDTRNPKNVVLLSVSYYGQVQNGYFKPWYDSQMLKEEIAQEATSSGSLPAYLSDALDTKMAEFNKIEADFKFAFSTDIHITPTRPYYHKFQLLSEIGKYGGVNALVLGGDISDGTYAVTQTMQELAKAIKKANESRTDLLVCQGNHDTGFAYFYEQYKVGTPSKENSITPKNWHDTALRHMEGSAVFDEENRFGGYFYKDYKDSKIRAIVLNTNDNYVTDENGTPQIDPIDVHMNEQQLQWLAHKALNFSDKADKTEWAVIVFAHASYSANSFQVVNGLIVEGLLSAFVRGASYTGNGALNNKSFTVTKDFSSQGPMEFICTFSGHLHTDRVIQHYNLNRPLIQVNCAVPIVNQTPPAGGTVAQDRTVGTLNAEVIDLVAIDRDERKIICKRFGAGEDRVLSY